jgi:hypothetical protein
VWWSSVPPGTSAVTWCRGWSGALYEALAWLIADGQVNVGGQQFHLAT